MNFFQKRFLTPLCLVVLSAPCAHAVLIQDFETDNSGVTPLLVTGEIVPPGGIVNRVPSGGNFIPTSTSSLGGNYFAEVALLRDNGSTLAAVQGTRIVWNDGPAVGGYASTRGHAIDVYFDDPDSGFYFGNDGFFFQPTILDATNSFDINAGGFGVRLIEDLGGNYWQIGADGNAKGYTGVTTNGSNTFYNISSAGWYTLETTWETNTLTGNIDQVNRIIEIASGNEVYSAKLEDVLLAGQAGALGAASLGGGDLDDQSPANIVGPTHNFGDLAIDNLAIVPEPASFVFLTCLLSLVFTLSRRTK